MRIFFLIILIIFFNYLQDSNIETRQAYINEVNEQTFLLLGDNDRLYYSCQGDCLDVIVTATDTYLKQYFYKTNKKAKAAFVDTFINSYKYLLNSKGFKTLTIKLENYPEFTTSLELSRK